MKSELNDERFKDIVNEFRKHFTLHTLLLNGSYAREDFRKDSDIDFVIVSSEKLVSADLKHYFEEKIKIKSSVVIFSKESFEKEWQSGSLLIWFLVNESIVLYDDGYYSSKLLHCFRLKKDFTKDIRRELKKIQALKNIQKYRGDYSYLLGSLYGIYKNIALYGIANSTQPVSNKFEAINAYYRSIGLECHEIEQICSLGAYYNFLNGPVVDVKPAGYDDKKLAIAMLNINTKIKRFYDK